MIAYPVRSLVRISVIIPLTSPQAAIYADGVLTKLENDFGGTTHSRSPKAPDEKSPFIGTWLKLEDKAEVLYREQILTIIVDADLSDNKAQLDFENKKIVVNSKNKLIRYLKTLKQQAEKILGEAVVWVTIQDIERIV